MSPGLLERLQSFLDDAPPESDKRTSPPPANWPAQGAIQIADLTALYHVSVNDRRQPAPVLHGVGLMVNAGQKLGVMGRTGSGKSSLLLAFLGFLEYSGSIVIDGLELRTVPRDGLRKRIIAISQSQVELEGTIRDNLLPYEKMWTVDGAEERRQEDVDKEAEQHRIVRETLSDLRLWEPLMNKKGLDTTLSEAGFSHGEMQLLCFARGVVRRRVYGGNLVTIDAATGGVDKWRDNIVQEMIRNYFHGCTILIVSHRKESMADADVHVKMAHGMTQEVRRTDAGDE